MRVIAAGSRTGFIAVAAIAFFAAWSVLSNIFCSVLIYTSRPFGLHDHIEVLEGGDKPGLAGEVMDITLVFTTLNAALLAVRIRTEDAALSLLPAGAT